MTTKSTTSEREVAKAKGKLERLIHLVLDTEELGEAKTRLAIAGKLIEAKELIDDERDSN